jgi:hypothetical protein
LCKEHNIACRVYQDKDQHHREHHREHQQQ